MAIGTEVGRIYIKVSPDTDGFREELYRQLKGIKEDVKVQAALKDVAKVESQISSLARDRKAKIDVDVKTDRFQRRLLGQIDSALSKYDAKLDVTPDDELLRRRWERKAKALKRYLRLPVDIDPEVAAARKARALAGFQALMAEMQEFALNQPINVRARIDRKSIVGDLSPAAIQRQVNREDVFVKLKAQMDESAYVTARAWKAWFANEKVDVLVQAELNKSSFARARAAIGLMFGKGIKVDVDIDTNRFERGLARTAFGLANLAVAGGKAAANMAGSLASGLGAVASGAKGALMSIARLPHELLLVVAVAALLPPVLALISGSLVALPGLLSGLVTPIAAIALGFDGIKKAAENSGLFDPTGGKKGEGGVGKALDEIRQKVSETFEKGLTPAFKQVADMMPQLTSGFQTVAQGISDMTAGAVQGFTNQMPKVQAIISNIGQGLSAAAPGVQRFTEAMIKLTDAFAKKFPMLGEKFSGWMDEFLTWVDKITTPDASGISEFDRAMSTLGETLRGLVGIVGDLFSSGWNSLSDPGFGNSMKTFVNDIRTMVNSVLPGLNSSFQTIANTLKPISAIVDQGGKLFDTLNSKGGPGGPKNGLDLLNLTSGPSNMSMFDRMWAMLKNPLARQQAKEAGSQAAADYADGWLGGGADNITSVIKDQIVNASKTAQAEALRSALTGGGVNDAVKNEIANGVGGAITEAQAKVAELGPQLQQSIDIALAPIKEMPTRIGESFGIVSAAIQGSWGIVVTTLTTGAQQAVAAVSNSFLMLPNAITGPMMTMASAAAGAVQNVVTVFSTMGVEVHRVVTTSFGQLPTLIQTSMDLMVGALRNGGTMAVQTVSAWGAQMVSTAMSFAGAMQGAGAAVGSAFAAGLNSMTGVVAAAAQNLMASARPMFPNSPAKEGPFSGRGWVTFSGQAIGEGFADGINSSTSDVVSAAKAMMQAIKEVFGSAEGLTLNFNFGGGGAGFSGGGGSGFSGLASGMSGLSTASKDFQSNITGAVAPAQQVTAETKAQIKAYQQQLDELEIRRKELMSLKYLDPKNEALKAELNQINQLKNSIGLEKNRLEYAQKYSGTVDEATTSFNDQLKSLTQMPMEFAKTSANSFFSDMGMSGGGVLGAAMDWGMGFAGNAMGSVFNFNVNSVDDALEARNRTVTRQSMGVL